MLSRWAQIKEWGGLPKDVREVVSMAVVILALAGAVYVLWNIKNASDKRQIIELSAKVTLKDSIISQLTTNCATALAANNAECAARVRELMDGTIAEYKATVADYKQAQRDILRSYDQTDRETKRITNTQTKANKTLHKAIDAVKSNTNEN